MAEVTVFSQPDDYASVYGELKYELQVPGTGSGSIGSVLGGGRGFKMSFIVTPAISDDSVGSEFNVLNTSLYNGVWEVESVTQLGDSSRVYITEGGAFLGNDTGNYEFEALNQRVIAQLWVGGSFFIEKTRYINNDNLYVFDFAKEMQVFLGNELEPLGFTDTALVSNSENFDTMSIKTAIVTDEIIGGVLTEVPQLDGGDLYDSGTDIIVINSTVPQVEWVAGSTRGEILSTGDLSTFVMGDDDNTKRFLTPSEPNQIIGSDEALELGFIIDNPVISGPNEGYEIVLSTFDSSGSAIVETIIRGSGINGGGPSRLSSGVWRFNAGPRSYDATVMPSNTATYTIYLRDKTTLAVQSETLTFTIDDKCSRTRTRFCWLNERGGYDSYTFKSPRRLGSKVKKDSHEKNRDYSKGIASRQDVITNVFAEDNMSTSTNKVVRSTAEWLQGLLESPEVWIELDDSNALHSTRIPVTLNNKSRTISDTYNGMFNINVRYKFGWVKDVIRAK